MGTSIRCRAALALCVFAGMPTVGSAFGQDLLSGTQVSEWKGLFAEYDASMGKAAGKVGGLIDQFPDSPTAFVDRLGAIGEIEKELGTMDLATRARVMPLLIRTIQEQLGSRDALVDTGGTKAGEHGFRAGFGDYDLEAPQEHIAAIRRELEKLVPPGTLEDHGSYIEVAHLRLIIFKRIPIDTIADLEKIPAEDLARDINDKEVYLHLRLPRKLDEPKGVQDVYQQLVKALEIQGHIKKGIHGALCNPQELIDQPEQLQTFAKSAMKSLMASAMWWTMPGGEESHTAKVKAMLAADGFQGGVLGFENKLEGYKNWAYVNPLLFENRRTMQGFQNVVRNGLALADSHSEELAKAALAALEELKKARPNDPKLEPLIIAARLYREQRNANQAMLGWTGVPDTIDQLLRHFGLPDDYEIVTGTSGGMHLIPSIYVSGGAGGSGGRGFAQATWRNQVPGAGARRSWVEDGPRHDATLRLVVVDLGSAQAAIDEFRGNYFEGGIRILQEFCDETRTAAGEQLNDTILSCSQQIPAETKELLLDSDFDGTTTHTQLLAEPGREISMVDFHTENALLVNDRIVRPVIDHVESIRVRERLTSDAEIKRMKMGLSEYQGGLPIPRTTPLRVEARFKCTVEQSRALVDPGKPTSLLRRGICRYGKCIVFIEQRSLYTHASQSDGSGSSTLAFCDESLPEWNTLESPFMRLVFRRQPSLLSIELRIAGTDSRYRGIACDGISELALAADITGDEQSLATIASVEWDVAEVPAPLTTGKMIKSAKATRAGRNRRTVSAMFEPPTSTPREQTQQVRLVVTSTAGQRTVSSPLSIRVVPPRIVMVHGIWSDYQSLVPLREYLMKSGATTPSRCLMVQYDSTTTESPLRNARLLQRQIGLDHSEQPVGALWADRIDGIKSARVNVIAHSLGGLLARLVIQGRLGDSSLSGSGASNILKLITIATPHHGSALADWYAEWDPNSFTGDSDPSLQDFEDLRVHVRTMADLAASLAELPKLRETAFEYGPAVTAMKASPNRFLDQLNEAARTSSANREHIRYYFVAGTEPICSRAMANVAAVFFYYETRAVDLLAIRDVPDLLNVANMEWADRAAAIKGWSMAPSELLKAGELVHAAATTPKLQQMIVGICELMSAPGTDGAVHPNSAIPGGLHRGQVGGTLLVEANHFSVLSDPATMRAVEQWLQEAPPGVSDGESQDGNTEDQGNGPGKR